LYPELNWVAPQDAVAQTVPDTVVPAIASLNQQELKTISLGLAAVRQKVDQLAANQQQMARDFTTKLQAAEQGILEKISGSPSQPIAANRETSDSTQNTFGQTLRLAAGWRRAVDGRGIARCEPSVSVLLFSCA
jgi:hypothetical protein